MHAASHNGDRVLTLAQIAADTQHPNCDGARSTQRDNIEPKLCTLALLLDCAVEACKQRQLAWHAYHDDNNIIKHEAAPAGAEDMVDWLAMSVHEPRALWTACTEMLIAMALQLLYVSEPVFRSLLRLTHSLACYRCDAFAVLVFWWLAWAYEGVWLMIEATLPADQWRRQCEDDEASLTLLRAHIEHYCERLSRSAFRVDNVHRMVRLFHVLFVVDVNTRRFSMAHAVVRRINESLGPALANMAELAAVAKVAAHCELPVDSAAKTQRDIAAAQEALQLSGFGIASSSDGGAITRRNALGCIDDPSDSLLAALAAQRIVDNARRPLLRTT